MSLPKSLPSERTFGAFFAALFSLAAAFAIYSRWPIGSVAGFLVASVAFGGAASFAPRALVPLNKLWFALGELLGKIVGPIVLGIIFFGILTPCAVIGRIVGRDELRLRRRGIETYWIERNPAGPEPQSFKNQF